MAVEGYHVVDDIEGCGIEVAGYLADQSHWQQPIFPDVQDCSRLQTELYFNIASK